MRGILQSYTRVINNHTNRSIYKTSTMEFYCHPCRALFASKPVLEKHVQKAHTAKKFPCSHCNKSLSTKGNRETHVKRMHPEKYGYVCTFCALRFDKITAYRAHLKEHIPKRFSCDTCGRRFAKPYGLRQHVATHSIEAAFRCDTCGRQYTTDQGLRRHNLHHQPKTVLCCRCGAMFHERSDLKRHVTSVHTEEKKLSCSTCNRKFKLQEKLTTHMRRHLNPRPHKCNICRCAYSQKRSLTKHRAEIHGITGNNYTG